MDAFLKSTLDLPCADEGQVNLLLLLFRLQNFSQIDALEHWRKV
jgi:hypothetical protein